MTTRQVVNELIARGHRVTYYNRKDGGILITSIDGVKYKAAKGNTAAREMIGAEISSARKSQLSYAQRQRRLPRDPNDEIYKEYLRVKKIWKKKIKAKKGVKHPAGYFGWNRIQYSIKHYGRDEALRRIREAEKYAKGLAYSKNVEYLLKLIKDAAIKLNSKELEDLYNEILDKSYTIREEWLEPTYKTLYLLNKGGSPKEVTNKVRKILHLDEV